VSSNQGSYDVVVTNSYGSVTSAVATLTALFPPSISAQPASSTNLAGSTVTFGVTAAGTAPLSYQWRKDGGRLSNGGNIGGAGTATLTLSSIVSSNQGSYDVVVTNSYGSVTSAVATLVLLLPPTIAIQPTNNHFQLTLTGAPSFVFAIQACTNLDKSAWMPLVTNASPFTFTDTNGALDRRRFYRAVWKP